MMVFNSFSQITTAADAKTAAGTGYHSCGCVGPQNGQPRCPCMMRGVIERDGRWIEPERDLGPARPAPPSPTKEI